MLLFVCHPVRRRRRVVLVSVVAVVTVAYDIDDEEFFAVMCDAMKLAYEDSRSGGVNIKLSSCALLRWES